MADTRTLAVYEAAHAVVALQLGISNVEYDSDWVREYDEVWDRLRELADERGIESDREDPAETRLQLRALHNELAYEVRTLLKENWADVDTLAKELIAHRTLDQKAILFAVRGSAKRPI